MNCLLCNKAITVRLSIKDILLPGPIVNSPICPACKSRFSSYINSKKCCLGCYKDSDKKLCSECQQWQQKYGWHLQHQALYRYNDAMKNFMHQYKFVGDYRLRLIFQHEFSQTINRVGADIIVPIPVTPETLQVRGFNQVVGLLREVNYQQLLQTKEKSKRAQSSKGRAERLAAPQPFVLADKINIQSKSVLLIDDVYTTGRTLYHAAALFKELGCTDVVSVSLAR